MAGVTGLPAGSIGSALVIFERSRFSRLSYHVDWDQP